MILHLWGRVQMGGGGGVATSFFVSIYTKWLRPSVRRWGRTQLLLPANRAIISQNLLLLLLPAHRAIIIFDQGRLIIPMNNNQFPLALRATYCVRTLVLRVS